MKDRFGPESAGLLQRLVDQVPSMLAYWDRDLLCRFANRAYVRWFGVEPDALIGTSIRDLLGPDLYGLNEPYIRGALAGEAQQFERILPGPDGVRRHSLAHYIPDVVDGAVQGFFATVTEITTLKQAEQALRESERKFRRLAESSPFVTFHSLADGRWTFANERWSRLCGLPEGESLGDAWWRLAHPDDREALCAAWTEAVAEGRAFSHRYRLRCPDGDERRVKALARPISADGVPGVEFVGAMEDETERLRVLERLRSSESFLDQTGRVAGVGGWSVDLRTQQVTWSERTRQIHEVGPDHVPTVENGIAFYAPEARLVIAAAVQAGIEHGTPWDLELPFITGKGRSIWVRAFGQVEVEDGVPVRLIGAFQDITEHRERRLELERENLLRQESERYAEELNRLLRERGEMLDVLAHEVRQPLNNASAAMQGAAAALGDLGKPAVLPALSRARAVLGEVMASIDNTLAVASLLARPDPIQREDTDVDTLVAVTLGDLPAEGRARVRVERATTTRTASMDMSLLRLALRNLLSNALRYSPPGSPVTVRLSDSDAPLALLIEVADTGSGITESRLPGLFERGGPPGHRRERRGEGMGLGLYIVRRVMELHGGMVELARNGPQGVTMRLVVAQSPGE